MGRLVAIEGLDGAGKRTLVDGVSEELSARGATVAKMAFPRYQVDVYGPLLADALHGRLGDLTDSVYAMAVLFALDRRAAAAEVTRLLANCDVLLVDRYVASNAAYGAARLHQDADGEFAAWVGELELSRFEVPAPDLQLLLRVPTEVARRRAERRESSDPGRARDNYESDDELQRRCGLVYDGLAARSWLAPWRVLTDARQPAALAEELRYAVG